MGWNGSGGANATPVKVVKRPNNNNAAKCVVAGLVVLLGIAAVWMILSIKDEAPAEGIQARKPSAIKTVKPAKAKPAPEPPKKDPPGYWNGKKISNDNRPPWMSPYHRIVDYGPTHTNAPVRSQLPIEEQIFEHDADQKLGAFLLTVPGAEFVGDCKGMFDEFTESFLESIKTPIIVSADDSDEVKELKKAVRDLKIDLKARLDAGENLNKLMEDTWNQMQQLGLYKEEIEKHLDELSEDETITEQDMDDYIAAANQMLDGRGCPPLKYVEGFKRKVKMRVMKKGLSVK